jgi:hypothetical protein
MRRTFPEHRPLGLPSPDGSLPPALRVTRAPWAGALCLGGLLLLATVASAQSQTVHLRFERLVAQVKEPEVTVTYRIDPRSFRAVQDRKLEPRLVLEARLAGGKREQLQMRLDVAEGKGIVRLSGAAAVQELEVSLIAGARGAPPLVLELGGVHVVGARLRIFRDDQPPAPPPDATPTTSRWANDPGVIDLCARTFPTETLDCMEAVSGYRIDPRPALAACGQTFRDDDERLLCARSLAGAGFDVRPAMRACTQTFRTGDARLACVGVVGEAAGDPTAIIDACRAARTVGARQACIERGVPREQR